MTAFMDQLVQKWHDEYKKMGIPSSFREDPSGSVVEFVHFLVNQNVQTGVALDLGCGRGRNSIYLAQNGFDVYSIDFVPEMIQELKNQAKHQGMESRIHSYCQSVTESWPFADCTFDIAIDAFCYKHQIEEKDKKVYRDELKRTLKPGAYYLLTLADIEDGYYGPLLANSPDPTRNVIVDPKIGIPSMLYAKQDIIRELGSFLNLVFHQLKKRDGLMHGKVFNRSTHMFFFQKT